MTELGRGTQTIRPVRACGDEPRGSGERRGPASDLLRSPGRAVRQEGTSKRNSGPANASAGRGRGRSVLKVFLKTVSKMTRRPGSSLSPPPLPLGRCTDQNDSGPELGPGHASGPSGQRQSDASAGEKSSPSPAAAGLRPHAGAAALAVTPQPGAPRRLRGVDAGSSRRHSPTATLRHPRPTLCRAKVTRL